MKSPFPRSRTRPRTAVTAIAALTAVSVLTGSFSPASARENEQHLRPGDIVDVQPSQFRLVADLPTPTRAFKVHYRSSGATGKPNVVSGTVIVPADGRHGTRPLITYAVGTVGMGDQCAPSNTFPKGGTAEAPLISGALARGWAVAVTDYEGLGTPGDHTYTVGSAEGKAVLDAARAAQRLPGAAKLGISERSPVGIMGYSQGGQASGWAAELHHSYAPELDVKGTASGGVPADLTAVAEGNDGDDEAGLVLMAAIGHDAAFPRLNLPKYLNEEGESLAALMRESCTAEATEAGAGKTIDDVTVENPLDQKDWQRVLASDRLGTRTVGHPVYLYHGASDEIIPYEVGKQLRADWCARGQSVQWRSYPLAQHVAAAVAGSAPAMNWLAARFAGLPTDGNCPA